ncbi:MAG: 16S rRNA (uracil(1498)-N(3))-methyltransferase [Dehalococcoidia bacterium]|nr:16S rRNA (uracil(1498)-N(3))-methyltransferase [Dehalococcoidia bacterium]
MAPRGRNASDAVARATTPCDGRPILMNVILFAPDETRLRADDPRAVHLLTVLRASVGDSFRAGVIDGPLGVGTITARDDDGLALAFAWGEPPPPLPPITVIIGLPRPPTARKILHEATALGVARLWFVRTALGERSYAQSPLWTAGEWRRHCLDGAQQAICTRIPEVDAGRTLMAALRHLPESHRVALDHEVADQSIAEVPLGAPLTLAIGAERGWTDAERDRLRAHGFAFAHLGRRVLRVETATIAALAVAQARLGLWTRDR